MGTNSERVSLDKSGVVEGDGRGIRLQVFLRERQGLRSGELLRLAECRIRLKHTKARKITKITREWGLGCKIQGDGER